MNALRKREIVIEIERVRTIRKRAQTTLVECPKCQAAADVLSLTDASGLFEVPPEELFEFVKRSACHYRILADDQVELCVPSLLAGMQRQNGLSPRRLSGDSR